MTNNSNIVGGLVMPTPDRWSLSDRDPPVPKLPDPWPERPPTDPIPPEPKPPELNAADGHAKHFSLMDNSMPRAPIVWTKNIVCS